MLVVKDDVIKNKNKSKQIITKEKVISSHRELVYSQIATMIVVREQNNFWFHHHKCPSSQNDNFQYQLH